MKNNDLSKRNVYIFGFRVGNHTLKEAVEWVVGPASATESAVFVNVNSINLGINNPMLKQHVNQADRVFADGSGIRLAAKYRGIQLKENVNGTDLLPLLCTTMAERQLSLYLLGAKPGVAERAAKNLKQTFPGLCIAGTHHGYFEKAGMESESIVERINASDADVLLVGFGSPDQEKWLADNKSVLNTSKILAVGGLFDFYSNDIVRAPLWMRTRGIEWVWRLLQEPRAKFKRYVLGNPLFMLRLWLSSDKSHSLATSEVVVKNGLSFYLQRLLAIFGLLAILPLLFACALLIKFSSRGPVFYRQIRVGKYGKRFSFYKFRSMYLPDDEKYQAPDEASSNRDGVCKKYFNDSRVTPIGKLLRKYSIDELPQLLNVVKGDMSLIGPRPALVDEVNDYELAMYRRFDVMPGLTGLWQVSGRADTTFEEQIALDIKYVNQRSWWVDLKILCSTVPAVLMAKGAY